MNAKNDGFMAQSPPAWDSYMPGSPQSARPPNSPFTGPHLGNNINPSRTGSPLALNPTNSPRSAGLGITTEEENITASPQLPTAHSPASSISILPSSMPTYHQAVMSGASPSATTSTTFRPGGMKPRTLERFTPVVTNPPGMSTHRRPKQTKWQFGIRSRNAPLEAVSCIYRALKRLGAEWVDTGAPDGDSDHDHDDHDDDDGDHEEPDDVYHSENSDGSDAAANIEHTHKSTRVPTSSSKKVGHCQRRSRRAPQDPWIIQARWKRFAPTRRADDPSSPATAEKEEDCVYVHLTIQLYQLEHDNYLVDFKCAGYERLLPPTSGAGKKKVGFEETLGGDAEGTISSGGEGAGRRAEDRKDVNSPFPFLDAAGALIIALAEAGD